MKRIEDYIGKRIAIHCVNQEEWDFIIKFDKGSVKLQSKTFPSREYVNIKDSNFACGERNWYIGEGYEIIEAKEFLIPIEAYTIF